MIKNDAKASFEGSYLNQMKEYLVIIQGKQSGPFLESTIQSKVLSGEADRDALCWTKGMTEWEQIHSVIALPPPVPSAIGEVQSYYIVNNDEQKGPYTETQLRSMWLNGLLLASTLYWRDGMAEWRLVAELCDSKPLSADAKKVISDAVQVMRPHCARALRNIESVTNDAVQSVRSVYTSAERNISEFNDELDKAKGKSHHLDDDVDASKQLTSAQKLAQGAYAFFARVDKTVTRFTLLRNPPLSKHFIYVCAAFVFLFIFGLTVSSLCGSFSNTSAQSARTQKYISLHRIAKTSAGFVVQEKESGASQWTDLSTFDSVGLAIAYLHVIGVSNEEIESIARDSGSTSFGL